MHRHDVIARLETIEPALRARGVAALFLFGSHSRDEASEHSDVDVFVDAATEGFYDLSNFMGVYDELMQAFPGRAIGYSTRAGLSKYVRPHIEREAIRVF